MPRPLATVVATLSLVAACTAAGTLGARSDHPLDGTIWVVATGERIDDAELAVRLDRADVAILGEIHDNPTHHARQAELVEALDPEGIALEMVPEASEEGIQVFLAEGGARAEIGPAIGWDRLGWPDWDMYEPILEAAPRAYVAGGGVSRGKLAAAMRGDAAAVFGVGASAYGLDAPLGAAERTDLEDEMIAAHCDRLPRSAAGGMIEAQRLRDARFAHAVRRAAAAGEGQAVLITGNGHARTDRGVPAYLAAADPGLTVISLGQVETVPGRDRLEEYAAGGLPYDFVWFSAPAERGDPCAAFE